MKNTRTTMTVMLIASIVLGGLHYVESGRINIVPLALFLVSVLYFCLEFIEEGKPMWPFSRTNYPSGSKYPTWADIPTLEPLPNPTTYPPMPKNIQPETEDGYTVGVDEHDNTIIKVTCNYSTTTLTMNQTGVRQMIRLLEATLPNAPKE